MPLLFANSYSFSLDAGESGDILTIFETDDDYSHYDGGPLDRPYHIFRVGKEPIEALAFILSSFISRHFSSCLTIPPRVVSHPFEVKQMNGLNVAVLKVNDYNVISTIVRMP